MFSFLKLLVICPNKLPLVIIIDVKYSGDCPVIHLMLRCHLDNTIVFLQGANLDFLIQERYGHTSLRCQ